MIGLKPILRVNNYIIGYDLTQLYTERKITERGVYENSGVNIDLVSDT